MKKGQFVVIDFQHAYVLDIVHCKRSEHSIIMLSNIKVYCSVFSTLLFVTGFVSNCSLNLNKVSH